MLYIKITQEAEPSFYNRNVTNPVDEVYHNVFYCPRIQGNLNGITDIEIVSELPKDATIEPYHNTSFEDLPKSLQDNAKTFWLHAAAANTSIHYNSNIVKQTFIKEYLKPVDFTGSVLDTILKEKV